jgi:hypothetical protein
MPLMSTGKSHSAKVDEVEVPRIQWWGSWWQLAAVAQDPRDPNMHASLGSLVAQVDSRKTGRLE